MNAIGGSIVRPKLVSALHCFVLCSRFPTVTNEALSFTLNSNPFLPHAESTVSSFANIAASSLGASQLSFNFRFFVTLLCSSSCTNDSNPAAWVANRLSVLTCLSQRGHSNPTQERSGPEPSPQNFTSVLSRFASPHTMSP